MGDYYDVFYLYKIRFDSLYDSRVDLNVGEARFSGESFYTFFKVYKSYKLVGNSLRIAVYSGKVVDIVCVIVKSNQIYTDINVSINKKIYFYKFLIVS